MKLLIWGCGRIGGSIAKTLAAKKEMLTTELAEAIEVIEGP